MKTLGFSFFILYAFGTTEAKRLRGMIAAMEIFDQRDYNVPPPTEIMPILPPTENTHIYHPPLESNFQNKPSPSYETRPHDDNHPVITTAIGGNNRQIL